MCNNFPNIRITEGNNFSIILPLRSRTYVATRPIDEEIDPEQLENVVVTFGGVQYPAQRTARGVQIDLPATLAVGTYNILLTADYLESSIRAAYESAVTIVPWSAQSTAEQYIAGSPIVLRAAYVLSGAMTDEELEALKEEYREKNAQLQQAIADAEEAKRELEEKAADLDGVAQEATLEQGVRDIREDISHIGIDTSDLAKEETAQAAKDAALALAPVAQAAEAYNVGKAELAANITAKGVPASASETLPELAEKVTDIAQQPIILSPSEVGDMYAKQQFGSLTTPNYWNLYDVLVQLLNDGRLINYGGILLAEYNRGYASLVLSGAGAGGAYVVSDMENGQFKMYAADTTHTWDTEFDGKGNRWVAYCFADEYHDFQITDTNTSPRSIFIGRKVGTIASLVDGRCSQIVVPDGNILRRINANGHSQQYGKSIVFRNIEDASGILFVPNNDAIINSIYIECDRITGVPITTNYHANEISSIIIKSNTIDTTLSISDGRSLKIIMIDCMDINMNYFESSDRQPSMQNVFIKSENANFRYGISRNGIFTNCVLELDYITNDKTKSFIFGNAQYAKPIKDIVLKDGWNKPLLYTGEISTEANMYAHILQRLKQDEPDCGDGVTITLGATNLAKLTSEESVQLLDDLTNIYGYTFA